MRQWLLIDYDDTLGGVLVDGKVHNNDKAYTEVIHMFNSTMSVLGFSLEESARLQQEVDQALCRKMGFAERNRFADSLVRTYRALATRNNKPVIPVVEESIARLGDRVFQFRYMPLPGALETLQALRENYRIAIVTKGNEAEQRKKVTDSGVSHFIDEFFAVGFKNRGDWEQVLTALQIPEDEYQTIWAIGNAPKSDINVPLSMGLNAIHVKQGGWVFEREDYIEPEKGRQLIVVNNIKEVLDHLQWS